VTTIATKRPPRDYQQSAAALTLSRLQSGEGGQRCYYALPTGTGKTRVLTLLVEEMLPLGRILILAHRKELVEQTARSVAEDIAGCSVGVVMADRNDASSDVVCATVQTLESPTRLSNVLEAVSKPFYAILIDESHHAVPGSSYARIIDACKDLFPDCHVVGCTATPYRNDKNRMQELLPTCTFERSIKQMQQAGILAPLRWTSVPLPIDFSKIKTGMVDGEKDYKRGALSDALSPLSQHIVAETAPALGSRPVCVFASSVAHAFELRDAYRAVGLSASAIEANTKKEERERILQEWMSGQVQVVCNCAILTEGFDFSPIAPYHNGLGALVIASPTLSPSRYLQMVGRGTRLKPAGSDFENCLVFDLAGNANLLDTKHITLPKMLQAAVPEDRETFSWLDFTGEDEEEETHEKKPRVFKIRDGLELSWIAWGHAAKNDIYYAGIDNRVWAAILPEKESGLYRAYMLIDTIDQDDPAQKWKPAKIEVSAVTDEAQPFRELMHHINHVIAQNGKKHLVNKNAAWRFEPTTPKQLQFLARLNKDAAHQAKLYRWNKGEVSQTINWYLMLPTLQELWKNR
jgi:superfamily II DNA or RNA helicase